MAELMKLERLESGTLDEVNALLQQLSGRVPVCTPELLQTIVESPVLELWVVKDAGKIVGMGELAVVLKPEGIVAQIEDVVVDEGQRGKGLGKQLSEKLIERARERGARVIQLSSRFSRVAANALYQKLGFELHETNSYQMRL